MNALIIFVFLAFAGAMIIYGFHISAKREEVWKNTAQRLNLEFVESGWFSKISMHGIYRGKGVQVRHETETRGSGKHSSTIHFAAISVDLEDSCWGALSLSRHGFGDSIAKFFGGEDLEVGHARFDADFRIKGRLDDRLRQCLNTPAVQSTIRGTSRMYGSFKIEGGKISIREEGMFTCENELTTMIERAIDTAITLDEALSGGGSASEEEADELLFPDVSTRHTDGEEQSSAIW